MNALAETAVGTGLRSAWVVLRDAPTRAALAAELSGNGWTVSQSLSSVREALAHFHAGVPLPDLVVSGLYFEDTDGFDLMHELAALPRPPAIYLLSHQQRAVIRAAVSLARERGLRVAGYADFPVSTWSVADELSDFSAAPPVREKLAGAAALSPAELRRIIDSRRIRTFLQPKVRIDTAEVAGFEALMRAVDENGVIITPDRLIEPLAASGMLADASLQVFEATVDFLRQCLMEGYPVSGSVNASLGLIADRAFCDELTAMVEAAGIDPSWVTVEITETEAMSDVATVTERTGRFRMRGFNLAIDDFGTAYSSFSQLSRLPFSELKIEKSFVTWVHNDAMRQAVVAACATLGTRLGLRVVAEGVESPLELAAVREAGCTDVQGFLVARPVPASRARAWLHSCQGVASAAFAAQPGGAAPQD